MGRGSLPIESLIRTGHNPFTGWEREVQERCVRLDCSFFGGWGEVRNCYSDAYSVKGGLCDYGPYLLWVPVRGFGL